MFSIPRCRLFALVAVLAMAIAPAAAASRSHVHKPSAAGSIVVHGRWTIDVRDTNGGLVHRYRFENSYVGGPFLAALLQREIGVGYWEIALKGTRCGVGTMCDVCESSLVCVPAETLTATVSGNDLVLQGSLTAPVDDTITDVSTVASACQGYYGVGGTVTVTSPCTDGIPVKFTDKSESCKSGGTINGK